jgi:hypothetical protein
MNRRASSRVTGRRSRVMPTTPRERGVRHRRRSLSNRGPSGPCASASIFPPARARPLGSSGVRPRSPRGWRDRACGVLRRPAAETADCGRPRAAPVSNCPGATPVQNASVPSPFPACSVFPACITAVEWPKAVPRPAFGRQGPEVRILSSRPHSKPHKSPLSGVAAST